ncbi:MAG: hypothetical protein RLZ10_2646 [Bacteroidota bacterium]|jgi:hypothetical protein
MKELIKKILIEETEELHTDPSQGIVAPSQKVVSDVCEKEKFCKKQGPITFGQLRTIIETAQNKNLAIDIGEGFYKAILRLLPWFFPQIAIAGFIGSSIRAFNKIIRPTLEDTRGYKSWWGQTLIRIMDTAEGDIPHGDPISKIFFISDGLLHMMDRKFKLKFARYMAEMASSKPDDEPVPEYFVENELRKWVNQKFLLDPPLPEKITGDLQESLESRWNTGNYDYQHGYCHYFAYDIIGKLKKRFPKKKINYYLLLAQEVDTYDDTVVQDYLVHVYIKIDDMLLDSNGFTTKEKALKVLEEWEERQAYLVPEMYKTEAWIEESNTIPDYFFNNRFCSPGRVKKDVETFLSNPIVQRIFRDK